VTERLGPALLLLLDDPQSDPDGRYVLRINVGVFDDLLDRVLELWC
jgi:hypothetical protein